MKHPYLNEDYEMFRKAFRKFLDKEAYPYYEQREKEHIIPREFWRKLGENGFLVQIYLKNMVVAEWIGDTPLYSKGKHLNKVGLHAQDTAELIFDAWKIPKENLLGQEGHGFQYMMEKLQQERLVVALAAQVAAEEMMELTLDESYSLWEINWFLSKYTI